VNYEKHRRRQDPRRLRARDYIPEPLVWLPKSDEESTGPRSFGGMGGVWGGRAFDNDDLFGVALNRACGERMRASRRDAEIVWGALSNVDWKHNNGDTASYTFRAAGDLIASIVGNGTDYMDFYCTSAYGQVEHWIGVAMAAEGWRWSVLDDGPLASDVGAGDEP